MKICTGAPIALLVCLLSASQASAQDRGFVRFLAGPTLGTAATSSIIGAGGGMNLSPAIQVTGEFGRMRDILPEELQDELDDLALLFTLETGIPIEIAIKVPALYGMGGLKYTFIRPGRLQPFVEGQIGIASISFDVEAEVLGIDLSDEIEEEADIDNISEMLVGLGGGVGLMLTDTLGLDLGYRYHRIFTEDPGVNVNVVYAALRLVFR